MRLILDECIDEALRHHFAGHECQTCRYAGFAGLANGDLLIAAEQAGFAVLVTVDQHMPAQQSLEGRSMSNANITLRQGPASPRALSRRNDRAGAIRNSRATRAAAVQPALMATSCGTWITIPNHGSSFTAVAFPARGSSFTSRRRRAR